MNELKHDTRKHLMIMHEYKDTELKPTAHTIKLGWDGRKKREWSKNGVKQYTEYFYTSGHHFVRSKKYKTVTH